MAEKDKIKWNKKYKDNPSLLEARAPSKILQKYIKEVKGNKALEIACGAGRNSIFMAEKNFRVDAFDISHIAIKSLKEKQLNNINAQVVDLENYKLKENEYDLIVKTNYLDRNIISLLKKSLKKNGILLIETYMFDENYTNSMSNPDFLLKKNELKTFFDDSFEILEYDEFENETFELKRMKKQAIIVRKKG